VPCIYNECMPSYKTLLSAAIFSFALLCPFSNAQAPGSPQVQEFQQVEDKWSDAISDKDNFALELVVSPGIVDISGTGEVSSRNQMIVALVKKGAPVQTLTQTAVDVHMLTDELALVSGTYILRTKNGTDVVEEKGIFTHIFQREHGRWMCIRSQRTIVVGDTQAKTTLKPPVKK